MPRIFENIEFWKALGAFAWPITALILALMFRGFLGNFLKKDQMTIKVAGMEISVAQATKQAGTALSDLQERVAALEGREPNQKGITQPPKSDSLIKCSILWVDDFPANNAFLIEKLENDGMRIRKEISTDAGLKALGSDSFDLIISDLGRVEGGRDNPFAGLEFSRAVRAAGKDTPILIFAGPRGLENREKLLRAGATDVTASSVDVFRFIEAHMVKAV